MTFCLAFLGRPNAEYCEWIINPQTWGGEIELMILSQYYQKQIATYDIQTTNCYVYGSDSGFSERAMLVYDGIHYDALARSPYKDAPEELDVTIYDTLSHEGHMITEGAVSLVTSLLLCRHATSLCLGDEVQCNESIHKHCDVSTKV